MKCYFEKSELTPSRKSNTHFENHFYHFEILAWLVIQKTRFFKNNNKIIQSKTIQ